MKLKEQRVIVLIDVQNLYYSAKNLYRKKVNFGAILKEAISGRKLITICLLRNWFRTRTIKPNKNIWLFR